MSGGRGGLQGHVKMFFFKKLFVYVILRLYTEFQCPTMYGTGKNVCVWVGTVVLIPIVVSSLYQAGQQAYMIEHMFSSS